MFSSVTRRANWALRHGSRTWTYGRRGFKTVLIPARHEVTPPHRTSQGARLYSSTPRAEGAAEDSIQHDAASDQWLQALETAATAQWLDVLPADPADRLRRAYALLMQVILYLHRPQNEIEQSLVVCSFHLDACIIAHNTGRISCKQKQRQALRSTGHGKQRLS